MFEKLFVRRPRIGGRSLIAFCHLSTDFDPSDGRSVYAIDHGTMSDVGFGEPGSFRIDHHAPRTESLRKYGGYLERFFRVVTGDPVRSLGHVEITEAFVHDLHHRCDIDLTGFQLSLTLSSPMMDRYRQFIGRVPAFLSSDYRGGWQGDLAISVSSPAFEFSEPRGSDPPYPPYGKTVRKLRSIRRFEFDRIELLKLTLPPDRKLPTDLDLSSTRSEDVLRLSRSRA